MFIYSAMLPQIVQAVVQSLHVVDRKKLVSHFLLHLSNVILSSSLFLLFEFAIVPPPCRGSPSQPDGDQFHLLRILNIILLKDPFKMIQPVNKFSRIQAPFLATQSWRWIHKNWPLSRHTNRCLLSSSEIAK